jgi:hypothetical protein
MAAQSNVVTSTLADARTGEVASQVYGQGIVAGTIGAATLAAWFLLLDVVEGRPLYTPSLLGSALFARGGLPAAAEHLPVSVEMALMFTWVHWMAFAVVGGIAARFLQLAERNPNFGFGILLLFVGFEFGFVIVTMLLAVSVLHALTLPAILVGNLLAAGAMAAYFRSRHPHLRILP